MTNQEGQEEGEGSVRPKFTEIILNYLLQRPKQTDQAMQARKAV